LIFRRLVTRIAGAVLIALAATPLFGGMAAGQGMPRMSQRLAPWSGIEPGPYGVGSFVVDVTDSSSSFLIPAPPNSSRRARTVPVRSWYPVEAGKHPLVVFAGGTGKSIDANTALWKHLASYGYVVAAIPSAALNEIVDETTRAGTSSRLATLANDLSVVLGKFSSRDNVDASRIAAVGFGFGGGAALALASRDPRVRAVVGFDPSFVARDHVAIMRRASFFSARRVDVPILEFHRADASSVDLSLMQSISGTPRVSIEIKGFNHSDFASYSMTYGPYLQLAAGRASRASTKADAYSAMVETTRLFLDDALAIYPEKSELEPLLAMRGLGDVWSKVPRSMIVVREWKETSF
jgi:dienelactone hydrolase